MRLSCEHKIIFNKMINNLLSSLQWYGKLGEELCCLEKAEGDVDVQYFDWFTRT